jgi:hypothetical protein
MRLSAVPLCVAHRVQGASVRLDQKAFDQLNRYNLVVKAPWVLLSNGIHHIAARIKETGPVFVKDIPHYNDLTQ